MNAKQAALIAASGNQIEHNGKMTDTRKTELEAWVNTELDGLFPDKNSWLDLETVSDDASFRRYFRVHLERRSFIAVDAPPENESCDSFVKIAKLLRVAEVRAPEVYSVDYQLGFMLLEDFGDRLYLPALLQHQREDNFQEANLLYRSAIDSLIKIQTSVSSDQLAAYDRAQLRAEMELFREWFCIAFLEMDLSAADNELIDATFSFLEEAALSQPVVAVHRDYHSRNLLIIGNAEVSSADGPGIIDFQDALAGPYSYDLVSLLRDCYIYWQPSQMAEWVNYYLEELVDKAAFGALNRGQFSRDLDFMGLQRHLKVMGIFARLSIRDKKPRYLADIPLVIRYFLDIARKYSELEPMLNWFQDDVLPIAKSKLQLDS